MNMLKTTAAAAALLALPFAASAATSLPSEAISANEAYSFSYTVGAGENGVIFNFNVTEDLTIPEFSLSASAPTGGVPTTLYQISSPAAGPSPFGILNLATIGADVVVGPTDYSAGDTFSVTFIEGVNTEISYTVSFATEADVVAPVPVPAAGLMLLTALGGAAAMRRRKKA